MDPAAEARIRELRRRVEEDSTSPLFLGLAEAYRAAGRLPDAIRTLEKGLQTHPQYVSAQVALARAYLKADRAEEALAMFTKALASDRGNLLSARSLAEIYLARGERIEAIKKYRLYRALSGDRGVNEIIERIERDLSPGREPPGGDSPPRGRVLADLYLAQGHYPEALALYQEMARADPSNLEIARLVDEVLARLEGSGDSLAARAAALPAPDAALGSGNGGPASRQARIEVLKRWLSMIKGR